MPHFLLTWLLTTVSLLITAYLVPGFIIKTFAAAAIAAVILGLVNAIVKPILILLTLPITLVSLGLFLFVINAKPCGGFRIAIWLVAALTPGFLITGFVPALVGSVVLSVVTGVLHLISGERS